MNEKVTEYVMEHDELKRKLYEAGSLGLDMSPGDPIALEALRIINQLERKLSTAQYERAVAECRLRMRELADVQPIILPKNIFAMCAQYNAADRFDEAMKVLGE